MLGRRFLMGVGRLAMVAALSLVAGDAIAQGIQITPLARDERLLVSFEVATAFSDDLKAAIESGLPTTFTYDVELRRSTALWVDQRISTARVTATVRYDNLTQRYQVTVMHDGRVESTEVTEDEGLVKRLVTDFDRLPLFNTRTLEPNTEYYIRVRARTSPRSNWSMVPWDKAAALGSVRFTFMPR